MSHVLYPYRQLPEPDFEVEFEDAIVDADQRTVDFRSAFAMGDCTIDVSGNVELHEAPLRAHDDPVSVTGVAVVISCRQTDFRHSTLLERSPVDPTVWTGGISLDSRNLRGTVTAQAVVGGTVKGVHGRVLTRTRPWTLLVDELPERFPNGAIPVKWVDFADPLYPQLHDFRDDLFYLNMSGPIPELYLNSRQSELRRVLPQFGRPLGPLGSLYDPVRTGIARSTWQALVQASLAGIVAPSMEGEFPDWPPVQWQADVLRAILPRVYLTDKDEALRMAWDATHSAEIARELVERALPVVGHSMVRDAQAVRNAVRILDRFIQEGE